MYCCSISLFWNKREQKQDFPLSKVILYVATALGTYPKNMKELAKRRLRRPCEACPRPSPLLASLSPLAFSPPPQPKVCDAERPQLASQLDNKSNIRSLWVYFRSHQSPQGQYPATFGQVPVPLDKPVIFTATSGFTTSDDLRGHWGQQFRGHWVTLYLSWTTEICFLLWVLKSLKAKWPPTVSEVTEVNAILPITSVLMS